MKALSLVSLAIVTAVATAGAAEDRFTIVPGTRFGPIRGTTSRRSLDRTFGAGAVTDAAVGIGEGLCTPGTLVFAGSPDEIEVAWQDAARTKVAFVVAAKSGGRWRTPRGVRVGTTLKELERLEGRVLMFLGFEWDYGGGMNWHESGGDMGLQLGVDERNQETWGTAPDVDEILGDRQVRSDHRLIRRLRITVERMTLRWGQHFEEGDCG